VIIDPQQPGAVLAMIVPPVSTGPSIGAFGSCGLLVNVSTATLRRAAPMYRYWVRQALPAPLHFKSQNISLFCATICASALQHSDATETASFTAI
jgi:hypothetical protein